MRIKKPLLSTVLFTAILVVGVIVLYFLTAKALETDGDTLNNASSKKVGRIEATV